MFQDPLFLIVVVAVVAVAAILMFGIGTFAKGGEFNRKHANRIMRWRLYAQALAVVLILLFVFIRSTGAA